MSLLGKHSMSTETSAGHTFVEFPIKIVGTIERRQMPVENVIKLMNLPDQVGGAITPVVLNAKRRLESRDRFGRSGDHCLLPPFDIDFNKSTGRQAQAVDSNDLNWFTVVRSSTPPKLPTLPQLVIGT
jgi:hypothetical protein